jgi:catechol 2,3-dioxygenase-like lactoylglutathione lyase family enzyme
VLDPGSIGGPVVESYLAYTGLRVTDLERSVRFYTDSFGLHEVARGDNSASGGGVSVLLRDAFTGQKLELNYYPPGSKYCVPYVPGEGLDHVAFRVKDLDAKLKQLAAEGFYPVRKGDPVEPIAGFRVAYLTDPDGNWVELWQQSGSMPKKAPETY